MKKILLLLLPGVETMEFSPFFDIFGWNEILGSKDIHLDTAGLFPKCNTSWNLEISSDKTLQEIEMQEYSALIVPGGFGRFDYFSTIHNPTFYNCVQKALEYNLYIVGICTGSILLASTKLFPAYRMTSYLLENERYFKQLEQHNIRSERRAICKDRKVWTSSSPATAIPLAFDLLEVLSSSENRKRIEQIMGF